MKPYLVDVPVKTNIWIRPECQRKQFVIIKQARPSILFLISDGGRNEKEWDAIYQNRKMYDEEVDWECTIYKLYEDKNNGMYSLSSKMREFIWSKVDRCIFLEDDFVPSISYFRFCAELLERYKDDERINVICGMNHLGVCENVSSDYFFSRQGSIWGIATWKRTSERYNDFEYGKDEYVMKLLKERTKHNKSVWNDIKGYIKQDTYGGHVAGDEFFVGFGAFGQNQLQIIPKKNMISNIGCTEDSAHADNIKKLPHAIRRVFNMPTYEIDFPIKHAKYVIPDVDYQKKRNKILARSGLLRIFSRKIERVALILLYGDIEKIIKKIRRKLTKYVEK